VKEKYSILLETLCGCTRLIPDVQYPGPIYQVMLPPKIDVAQQDLFEEPMTTVWPNRRTFEQREVTQVSRDVYIVRYVERR
jgi:hypothetical protein